MDQFASNMEPLKGSTPTPKSKPKLILRSTTPVHGQKPRIFENKQPQKIIKTAKVTTQTDFSVQDSKSKTTNRDVSSSARSRVPAQMMGFSSDTPPNLRTNRATSATRGRPVPSNPTFHQKPDTNSTVHQKSESTRRPSRRQSSSPSVTRGRKEGEGILGTKTKKVQMGNNSHNNGTQILGSRMVDRVLNARKFGAEEREPKLKPQTNTSWNNGRIPGSFVRTIPESSPKI